MDILAAQEKERYHRQIILPGCGQEAQKLLKQAVVFIAGAGGLGSPVALYLASAGIGSLKICDPVEVELSNLNRQILHSDKDLGRNKAESAKKTLTRINPHVSVAALSQNIEKRNVHLLVDNARESAFKIRPTRLSFF